MTKSIYSALALLFVLGCSNQSSKAIDDLANAEFQIDNFIRLDGISVHSEYLLKDSTLTDKLIFSFNDRQCMDCITQNLAILGKALDSKSLSVSDLVIIADFSDQRMLKSYLSRFKLEGIAAINSKDLLFDDTTDLYDLPTFFLFKPQNNTAHFVCQPSVYTLDFSKNYINSISKKLNFSK